MYKKKGVARARARRVLVKFGGERIRITDRDYKILKEIDRWRFSLSRQVRYLGEFKGQRATDRRLKKLIEMKYIIRKKYLYGVPSLYYLASSGQRLILAKVKPEHIRIEQIFHNISVVDTVIFFLLKYKLPLSTFTSEKELHQKDGFSVRKHRADFVFTYKEKEICVEVELTQKSKQRLETNVKNNFMDYHSQIWVIPSKQVGIINMIKSFEKRYPNIKIILWEEVESYVRNPSETKCTEELFY